MNRRFFLKLFPAASAAMALPAAVAVTDQEPKKLPPKPVGGKWHGNGYYEVGEDRRIFRVARFGPFDDPKDGRCFRFECTGYHSHEIFYRYEAHLDEVLVKKVGEF